MGCSTLTTKAWDDLQSYNICTYQRLETIGVTEFHKDDKPLQGDILFSL